jgi:hypothetical protein
MRDTRVQNLLFLLTAAPLGVGCVITGDDTDTEGGTAGATNGTTVADTEPPATDTGPAMTGDMTSSTGPVADSGSSGPGVDSGSSGPGPETTGGIEIPEVCMGYGDKITECYDEKQGGEAAAYCAMALAGGEMYYGAECAMAISDWYACLSALTCKQLTGADPTCEMESMTIDETCVAA